MWESLINSVSPAEAHWDDRVVEALALWGENEWSTFFSMEKRQLWGKLLVCMRRLLRRWKPGFLQWYTLKWEVQTGYKEWHFHPEDGQAAEQATQRGCAVLSLGVFRTWLAQPGLSSELTLLWTGLEFSWGTFQPEFSYDSWISCCSSRLLPFPHHVELRGNNKLKNEWLALKKGIGRKGGLNVSHYLVCLLMESAIFLLNLCDFIRELGKKENLNNLLFCSLAHVQTAFYTHLFLDTICTNWLMSFEFFY